jgi:hypothetical protein
MWQGKSRYRSSLWKRCWFDRNKSAIDLRIPLNRTVNWDNDVRGCRFEEWKSIWVYHMYCYWRPSYQEGTVEITLTVSTLSTFLCMSKARTWIFNVLYCGFLLCSVSYR